MMFTLLRRFGWIAGLVAAARTPAGQRVITKVKTYANDPDTRRKLGELRTKITAKSSKA